MDERDKPFRVSRKIKPVLKMLVGRDLFLPLVIYVGATADSKGFLFRKEMMVGERLERSG